MSRAHTLGESLRTPIDLEPVRVDCTTHWLDRSHPNALNCIRLVLASTVIVSHGSGLMSYDFWHSRYALGALAVNAFFIISGFLITGSWLSAPDKFFRARVVRIYPGFIAAFLFSLGVAAIFRGQDWLGYLKSVRPSGVIGGLLFLDASALNHPELFAGSPLGSLVNGAMWTIPLEFLCYIGVAMAGSVSVFRRRWLATLFFAVATFFALRNVQPSGGWGSASWPRFASMFSAGVVLYLHRELVPKSALGAVLAGLMLLVSLPTRWFVVTQPIAGAYLIFWAAYSAPRWLCAIGARNDISYGVYLYAFPIQQAYWQLAEWGYLPKSVWVHWIACLAASIVLGWASWLCVEKRVILWAKSAAPQRKSTASPRRAVTTAP